MALNPENTAGRDVAPGLSEANERAAQSAPLLRMVDVSVNYGPVRAMSDVSLDILPGRIHAIIGENGAGKSTLLKTIAGTKSPSEGHFEINGRRVELTNAHQAQSEGISCVFQEMSLIPDLSVAENIQLLNPPRRFGLIDRRQQRRNVRSLLDLVGAGDLDPDTLIKDLPLSRQQLVEIAKGLAADPKLLILDESTSALTNSDTQHILGLVRKLRDQGMAILYVSHRLGEIRELADDCTVFRGGRKIETFPMDSRSDNEIVELMLGRSIEAAFPPLVPLPEGAPTLIDIENLAWDGVLKNLSANVRRGEIVGIGGLDGHGQHDFLLALFGALKGLEGNVLVEGTLLGATPPSSRIRQKTSMAFVPEDRGTYGLAQQMSVGDNILLADRNSYFSNFFRQRGSGASKLQDAIDKLKIKVSSPNQPAFELSGGNQQKIVLAKWLVDTPDILLLDDPTRGIDVGTKLEIFELLQELAAKGCAILLYSSDYQELCHCCHRVLVFYEGSISHEIQGDLLTETNLVNAAFNLPLVPSDAKPLASETQ